MATSTPEVFAHAEAVKGMEQALLDAVASCLAAPESHRESFARGHHRNLMRKFRAFLDANPDKPIYMSELSAELRVCARTMRTCCQEHLGMGLKRYLLLRRMHFVRRALHEAHPDVTRVTDVATLFGFWELGRFAVAYKLAFGESPSATLRKN